MYLVVIKASADVNSIRYAVMNPVYVLNCKCDQGHIVVKTDPLY